MRAEIFLAAFLGGLLAIFVYKVFVRTVVWPVSGYLIKRALIKRALKGRPLPGQSTVPYELGAIHGEFASIGPDYLPPPDPVISKQVEEWQRHFQAQQELCIAALDARDGDTTDRLISAAQAFKEATPERKRKQMRAQLAFRKAMAAPESPS